MEQTINSIWYITPSQEQIEIESRIIELTSKIDYISNNKQEIIQSKLSELNRLISKLEYKEFSEKNICMKQNITDLRDSVQTDPDKFISDEIKINEDLIDGLNEAKWQL